MDLTFMFFSFERSLQSSSPWVAAPFCRPWEQQWDLIPTVSFPLLTVLVAWDSFWGETAAATHLMGKQDMSVLSQRHILRSPFSSPPHTQDLPCPGHCKTLHNSTSHTRIWTYTQFPALFSAVPSFPSLCTPT